MSKETLRLIRDGARTQDGHLDFHTVPELSNIYMNKIAFYSIVNIGQEEDKTTEVRLQLRAGDVRPIT